MLSDVHIQECSICLEEIHKNTQVARVSCGHIYHIECSHMWIERQASCPMCNSCINLI